MVASKAPDLIHIYEDRVREVRRRLDICVICDSSERATIFKNEPWCSDNCRKEYFKAHNPQPVEMSVDDRDKTIAQLKSILGALLMKVKFGADHGISIELIDGETRVVVRKHDMSRFSDIFKTLEIEEFTDPPIFEIRFSSK